MATKKGKPKRQRNYGKNKLKYDLVYENADPDYGRNLYNQNNPEMN